MRSEQGSVPDAAHVSACRAEVSLSDTLDFWVEDPDSSEPICSMEVTADSVGRDGIPTDGTNLVMRALALFAEKTGEQRRPAAWGPESRNDRFV